MRVGNKVFIDGIFKTGYIYSFDKIANKIRVVCIENKLIHFYDVYKEKLYLIN